MLAPLVANAQTLGASDLHLEGGLPATVRVRGELRAVGEPISPHALVELGRELVGENWDSFVERGSADLAQVIAGVRCRINLMSTARGVGMAIRLLAPFSATLKRLNLHPGLRQLIERQHGLVLVTGPTGSGKSTTLAALIHEINLSRAAHIITIESPIEYVLAPRRSLIRQREVFRHTPSVAQALTDALREDPDVVMVGEMREPESIRLTLNAAETGHLVLATLHSGSCVEALQRVVSAFPPEVQPSVSAQLADCLVGVVSQRLRFHEAQGVRVPECELLMASSAVRGVLRGGQLFKLGSVIEGGGPDGSLSWERYRDWLQGKSDWVTDGGPSELAEPAVEPPNAPVLAAPATPTTHRAARLAPAKRAKAAVDPASVLEIDEAEDPAQILAELDVGPGRGNRR